MNERARQILIFSVGRGATRAYHYIESGLSRDTGCCGTQPPLYTIPNDRAAHRLADGEAEARVLTAVRPDADHEQPVAARPPLAIDGGEVAAPPQPLLLLHVGPSPAAAAPVLDDNQALAALEPPRPDHPPAGRRRHPMQEAVAPPTRDPLWLIRALGQGASWLIAPSVAENSAQYRSVMDGRQGWGGGRRGWAAGGWRMEWDELLST